MGACGWFYGHESDCDLPSESVGGVSIMRIPSVCMTVSTLPNLRRERHTG